MPKQNHSDSETPDFQFSSGCKRLIYVTDKLFVYVHVTTDNEHSQSRRKPVCFHLNSALFTYARGM